MADQEQLRRRMAMEEEAEAEAGGPGHNPYAPGETEKQRAQANTKRRGDYKDAAVSWADRAALGAGPQISGAMATVAHAARNPGSSASADLGVYRDARDEAAERIKNAEETSSGDLGGAVGAMSTPGLPVVAKGATVPERALQAAKVGAGAGALNAAFKSPQDLTQADLDTLKRFLLDTGQGALAGGGGGLVAGTALGMGAKPARAVAETQALRAAGLEAGIKNKVRKDLGVPNMEEARKVGRGFLDEGLIPVVGSSEAVGKNAEKLAGQAGNAQQAALLKAEMSGTPLDATRNANAVRRMLLGESAVADELSGDKARALADALESQGQRTPGSYVGQNKAKSDAWKSANFDADAKMSPVLYRKAVGAARDDLEQQVAAATDPTNAAALREANKKYGTAADALKLAENASTRDAARKGFTTADLITLFGGAGTGGVMGRPVEGTGVALATLLGKKAFDKYGHSSAARFADFLANRSGGGVGGQSGAAAWSRFLKKDDDE